MLAKRYRLPLSGRGKKAGGGKELFQKGRKISSPYFLIKASPNNLGYNRFAAIISTKVDKRSSRRHFWKRRILDCLSSLPESSQDFLVIVSPRIKELNPQGILSELDKLFS